MGGASGVWLSVGLGEGGEEDSVFGDDDEELDGGEGAAGVSCIGHIIFF